MRLGLTSMGWINYRKQAMLSVHFLRKGEGRSLCNRHIPYRQNFDVLPRNAVLCDECRRSPDATAAHTRGQEGKAARRPQQVPVT